MHRILSHLFAGLVAVSAFAADPTATAYSFSDCQGSAKPYPVPTRAIEVPDSLTPVMINHVGRHGARFAASPSHISRLRKALEDATRRGTITPLGKRLTETVVTIENATASRWGQLDSLGAAEQRGIAARMYASFPELFAGKSVNAISSYVPRCVMSMYEFTHQLAQLDKKIELTDASGRRFSTLMRFFSDNPDYKTFVKSEQAETEIKQFTDSRIPMSPLRRVLGKSYPLSADSAEIAMAEYSVLAGMEAIGLTSQASDYFSLQEFNTLWSIFNLRQYIDRTATTLSTVPADIASPLLTDLIETTDAFIRDPQGKPTVNLRFGHAETLMPLLSLMKIPGCSYLTRHFDTVALHWRDFDIVPMAANLQMILFRSDTGTYYVRVDLNERPVKPIPGSDLIYVPWNAYRQQLIFCLP